MRKIFLAFILVICSNVASAITITEALTNGYGYNENFQKIKEDFLIEIEDLSKAVSNFLPNISLQLRSTKEHKSLSQEFGNKKLEGPIFNDFSLSLSQPLFNGFSSVHGLKSARYGALASHTKYYLLEQDEILKMIEAYLQCVEYKEQYKIQNLSVKSNALQLKAVQEKFRLGEATEIDLENVRQGLSSAKATKSTAYANYESSKSKFYKIFGVEAESIEMPATPGDLPSNLDAFIEKAENFNLSVKYKKYQLQSVKNSKSASIGKLLPRVSMGVDHIKHYNSSFEPISRIEYGGTLDKTVFNLSVTIPILEDQGRAYSEIRVKKAHHRKAAVELDLAIKDLKNNCKTLWLAMEAAKKTLTLKNETVRSAEIAYNGVVQGQLEGARSVLDFLNQEERLNRARIEKVSAHKDLVLYAYQIKSFMAELTAKSIKLEVDYFDPGSKIKKIKR